MKPEDLKSPFPWAERKILIKDQVWYVPKDCIPSSPFSFNGWEHSEFFGNQNPVFLEYCSGNGAWIADKARSNPQVNWVALEMLFERVRKIWAKGKNHSLNNLFAICGEALATTKAYFPNCCVAEAYVNFPDPWPKRRHAKFRLIQGPFVREVHRILQQDGVFTLVTDDITYSNQMIDVILKEGGFKSLYPEPYYSNVWEGYGSSYFDDLWREKGREIRYHRFVKVES